MEPPEPAGNDADLNHINRLGSASLRGLCRVTQHRRSAWQCLYGRNFALSYRPLSKIFVDVAPRPRLYPTTPRIWLKAEI